MASSSVGTEWKLTTRSCRVELSPSQSAQCHYLTSFARPYYNPQWSYFKINLLIAVSTAASQQPTQQPLQYLQSSVWKPEDKLRTVHTFTDLHRNKSPLNVIIHTVGVSTSWDSAVDHQSPIMYWKCKRPNKKSYCAVRISFHNYYSHVTFTYRKLLVIY